jgi:hypothetical protein
VATELRRRSALLLRGPGNYLADAEFWVDPEVWHEIRDAIADAAARLHRSAQAPRSPGAIRVSATLAFFGWRTDRADLCAGSPAARRLP